MNRPRRVMSACLAVVALGALGACSSQPSNRRVVRDVIESLRLREAQEGCMLTRLDDYTDDQLDAIAEENETWDPAESGATPDDASESMQQFIADFEGCRTDGGPASVSTATSEPSGASVPSSSIDAPATSAPTDTTEAPGSTTPSDTSAG